MDRIVRRTLAVAVASLAALVVCAPALAQAPEPPSLTDRCDPEESSYAMCVGKEKLAERASAECRRAGDTTPADRPTDKDCQTPFGHPVDRGEIDAYRNHWVHRALEFQYRLGHDVPFANAPWLGTHNSYNSTSEFPTLSHTDSNQQLSLVDQLRIDMRSLEIDVHWAPSPRGPGFAPVVCHAQDNNVVHPGCSGERLLGEVLTDVAGWLNDPANRDEVLLLYLEDHVDGNHAAVRQVLESKLKRPGEPDGSLIYRAAGDGEPCRSLPLDHTRRQVLNAGARVVIVGDCGAGWASAVFTWPEPAVRVEERPPLEFSGCGGVADSTFRSKLVRFYEDSTFVTPAAGSGADAGLTPENSKALVRCGTDLFGFDQILPFDGRLESVVWSWAPDQPNAANGECAFQRGDERWATGDCAQPRRAACRTATGGWTLTGAAVAYADAEAACDAAGGRFDLPRTGNENLGLRTAAASGDEVWVRHREAAAPADGPGGGGGAAGVGAGSPSAGPRSVATTAVASAAPARRVARAASARCRLAPARTARRQGTLLCAVRLARGARALASVRLTRGTRTYARTRQRLAPGGGLVRLRVTRPLARGRYAVTIDLTGGTVRRLRQRVAVR